MTLQKSQWFRSHRKWVVGLLLLLCASGAALAVFAWKRCDEATTATPPIARPLSKNPAPRPATKEEPKQWLVEYSLPVDALAFSRDGMRLATAALNKRPPYRGEVRIWDLVTGREERGNRDFPGIVFSLAFSPDGKTLASGGQGYLSRPGDNSSGTGEVRLWNLDTDAKPFVWQRIDEDYIYALAFSPQGDRLAAGGNKGSLNVYNRTTGKPELSLQTDSLRVKSAHTGFSNLAFSTDGKKIAWGGTISPAGPNPRVQGVLQVWDAVTGKPLITLHPPDSKEGAPIVRGLLFLPDNNTFVASCDTKIYFWNLRTGALESTLTGHQGSIDALALSPDGRVLASSDCFASIKLWQVSSRREKITLRQPTIILQGLAQQQGQKQGSTVALAFDSDGEILASSTLYRGEKDRPGIVQLWDLVSLKEITLPK